jgi:hypothetical protein
MGRRACTEPQCLYKGALFTFHSESKEYTEIFRPYNKKYIRSENEKEDQTEIKYILFQTQAYLYFIVPNDGY